MADSAPPHPPAVPAVSEPMARRIWDMKYRLKAMDGTPVDETMADTFRRVARALASAESPEARGHWESVFFDIIHDFRFLPAGRILAGAGAERDVTLFNCFVMGTIPDDMAGIFENLKEAALTMQQGGGIGYDFSPLRPKGAPVKSVGADASGPLSFMDVWDVMCRTIISAGYRRGAMMATMRCDHPDIEAFIEAKKDPKRLRMFNLSVLATDAFMEAVAKNKTWNLVFEGAVYKTLHARDLWNQIMRATYDYAEPGVIFIDRINSRNNLYYAEEIRATNPCGEQPLPPYGACLLGSVNLARLVRRPFTAAAHIDEAELADIAGGAVRLLDNAIDISNFPLEQQRREALAKRRIGLGVTGLADALIMCRQRYGDRQAQDQAAAWMHTIERTAYLTSAELAREKGAFPLYDADQYRAGETIQDLDNDVQAAIARHGIRNALLTSIAPTGTISLFSGNVSSGIEPVFSLSYTRTVLMSDGSRHQETVHDYAHARYQELFGEDADLPDYFVTAQTLAPMDHLGMQAALQRYVDSSISKTINCPEDLAFEDFKEVYQAAYRMGCKGCTTYRPNPVTGAVLAAEEAGNTPHRPDGAPDTGEESAPVYHCPRCGAMGLMHEDVCETCVNCGYSRCH